MQWLSNHSLNPQQVQFVRLLCREVFCLSLMMKEVLKDFHQTEKRLLGLWQLPRREPKSTGTKIKCWALHFLQWLYWEGASLPDQGIMRLSNGNVWGIQEEFRGETNSGFNTCSIALETEDLRSENINSGGIWGI